MQKLWDREVSIFLLSTYISVSVQKSGGETGTRSISVPINGIHLEKLCRLSRMADMVCRERPEPGETGRYSVSNPACAELFCRDYNTGLSNGDVLSVRYFWRKGR